MLQVVVDDDIGDLYKVRVGLLGAEHHVDWYSDYNRCPSWYLQKVSFFFFFFFLCFGFGVFGGGGGGGDGIGGDRRDVVESFRMLFLKRM